MRIGWPPILSCTAAGVFAVGCSDNTHKLTSRQRAAFDNAAPALKTAWERGLSAGKADDYLSAKTNLISLLGQPISPEQLIAVQMALADLNERIQNAANKGNVSPQQALAATTGDGSGRGH